MFNDGFRMPVNVMELESISIAGDMLVCGDKECSNTLEPNYAVCRALPISDSFLVSIWGWLRHISRLKPKVLWLLARVCVLVCVWV